MKQVWEAYNKRIIFDVDITIFNIKDRNKELVDSNENQRVINKIVRPIHSIVKGQKYTIEGE